MQSRGELLPVVTDVDLQIIVSMLMKVLNLKFFMSVSGSCRETVSKLSLYQVQSWRTNGLKVPPAVFSPQDVPELHQFTNKVVRCSCPPWHWLES